MENRLSADGHARRESHCHRAGHDVSGGFRGDDPRNRNCELSEERRAQGYLDRLRREDRSQPHSRKGLLQSNGPVGTAGGIVLDGRNHTLPPPDPPTLIDTTGTYAVWCTTTFSVGGSSKFGGTV